VAAPGPFLQFAANDSQMLSRIGSIYGWEFETAALRQRLSLGHSLWMIAKERAQGSRI